MISKTPRPPYYAVIFSSVLSDINDGYNEMANAMEVLARKQTGFLGVESARDEVGITVSYWKDLKSIAAWRENLEHAFARKMGREKWYRSFKTRIALVEHDYGFGTED